MHACHPKLAPSSSRKTQRRRTGAGEGAGHIHRWQLQQLVHGKGGGLVDQACGAATCIQLNVLNRSGIRCVPRWRAVEWGDGGMQSTSTQARSTRAGGHAASGLQPGCSQTLFHRPPRSTQQPEQVSKRTVDGEAVLLPLDLRHRSMVAHLRMAGSGSAAWDFCVHRSTVSSAAAQQRCCGRVQRSSTPRRFAAAHAAQHPATSACTEHPQPAAVVAAPAGAAAAGTQQLLT